MNVNAFKKRLRKLGLRVKRIFFNYDPIRAYDRNIHIPHFADMKRRVKMAMQSLELQGLVPSEDYAKAGADCDNWATWIWTEVSKQWSKEHEGQDEYPAYAFGWADGANPNGQQHEFNVGVCVEGEYVWDYGMLADIKEYTIDEVTFK